MAGYSQGAHGPQQIILTKDWAMINCIFHTEDTPSLGINLGGTGYSCFGCGAKGHYGELKKILLPELYGDGAGSMSGIIASNRKVGQMLNRFKNAEQSSQKQAMIGEKISRINDFESNANYMVPWEADWRGMSAEFLRAFGGMYWNSTELDRSREELVTVPRIYFPFKHPRYTNLSIGYAARRLDDVVNQNAPKYRNSSVIATKQILYLLSAIKPRSPIVVVEGPFDALKLWYHGIPAVASLGTNQWSETKTGMILSRSPCCVVGLGDGDEAGAKFNNVLFSTFREFIPKKYYQIDLPKLLPGGDPGSFDQAWIDYVYQCVNGASNGYLDEMRASGMNYIQQVDNLMLAGV
jgi:hypothetical protein